MYKALLLSALSGFALASAEAQAPPVVYLTETKSGVVPVAPTPFPTPGFPTIEGALTNDGAPNPGFTGLLGNASIQQNAAGASFMAMLPTTNFDNATGSLITGSIMATVPANGAGVMFNVNFTGFPSEATYGPFVYHIHAMPVPADGNCTATMGHLDPTDRGELYPCDNTMPQTCQAGDLAGKHGNITAPMFMTSYMELYLSTDPSSPYYFGDKSIVIHASNTTRLTCANFMMMSNSTSSSNSSSSVNSMAGGMPTATGAAGGSSSGSASSPSSSVVTTNDAATSSFSYLILAFMPLLAVLL